MCVKFPAYPLPFSGEGVGLTPCCLACCSPDKAVGKGVLPSARVATWPCSRPLTQWRSLLARGSLLSRVSVPAGQPGKLMYVMHNSEFPLSCFALFEGGPCLVADANFDVLMVKLKGFFQSAKASKIETRGTRYQYCDFLVKVGTVTMGPSARGISVEVSPRGSKSSVCRRGCPAQGSADVHGPLSADTASLLPVSLAAFPCTAGGTLRKAGLLEKGRQVNYVGGSVTHPRKEWSRPGQLLVPLTLGVMGPKRALRQVSKVV